MTDTATRYSRIPGGVDGQLIRRRRAESGLTAKMLADKVAPCSEQHICAIERGVRQPSPPLLRRIALALHTQPAKLMHPMKRAA